MNRFHNRRDFLSALSSVAAGGLVSSAGVGRAFGAVAAEPPPETTTVRIAKNPTICVAPQYIVQDLLAAEGFTNVVYVPSDAGVAQAKAIGRGDVDFSLHFSGPLIIQVEQGEKITILAGVHVGCFELFARDGINSIADLKGKSVGVQGLGTSQHVFLSSMATLVGLDPARDIHWVTSSTVKPIALFVDGKIDAFLGFPPEPQQLRAQHIGNVIVNSATDQPWAQYFCCMLAGNSDFVRKNPVAAKRVLRAILKAADLCVSDPQRAAKKMVEGGFTARYDYALQTLYDVPYGKWRDYDPEDTLRFYALRLREAGMIKSSPNQIIAAAADWRFLNEVKRELKG